MRKTLTMLLSLVLFFLTTNAQTTLWGFKVGNTLDQVGNDVKTDLNGNVIIVGAIKGTNVDFDRSQGSALLSSAGDNDIYVAKYTADGAYLWAFRVGGSGNDAATNVAIDAAGNIYVSGWFRGTNVDFDPSSNTYNLNSNGEIGNDTGFGGDAFLAKYDSNGQLLWAFNIGGSGMYDVGGEMVIDTNGDVLLSGSYMGSNVDFDPSSAVHSLTASGTTESFLAKYSSTGQYIWALKFGGAVGSCAARSLVLDKNNNIYLLGHHDGVIDLNPGSGINNFNSNGCGDIFLVKLDNSGQYTWGIDIGGSGCDYPWSIGIDTSSNIYIAGQIASSNVDFDPGTGVVARSSAGGTDGFVAKYTKDGAFVFVNMLSSSNDDAVYDLALHEGGYAITGLFSGTCDLDPSASVFNLTSNGGNDAIVAEYNLSGQFQRGFKIGSTLNDIGRGIAYYTDNNSSALKRGASSSESIYVTGYFQGSNTDFDPSSAKLLLSSGGGYDMYLAKYTDLDLINTIKGAVYLDKNSNGIKDPGEPDFNAVKIKTIVPNIDTMTVGSSNGKFTLLVDTGRFITTVAPLTPYFTAVPSRDTSDFSSFLNTDSLTFAIQPIPGIKDLYITMSPMSVARPGFPVEYRITYFNRGTDTIATGYVKLVKDSKLNIDLTLPATSTSIADTLTWNFSSFAPGSFSTIRAYLRVAVPPTANNGDTLKSKVYIEPIASDSTPANNVFSVTQRIQGSYDPNDKKESHGGKIAYSTINDGEYLNYTIRFQNTGTDTAFNIRITDTLSDKLDWNSFEMITSSHEYQLTINKNHCTWRFLNINLVDSLKNEALSHGFISFRIKAVSTIAVNDVITNRASIYFDYNIPVLTNAESTIIISNSVLPVKLIAFEAQREGKNNKLNWTVSQEINLSHYEVERSTDGKNFKKLANVTSSGDILSHSYNYYDNDPANGINYYRIKFVDKDGKFEYSSLRKINNLIALNISIYPNPVKDIITASVNVARSMDIKVEIIDIEGKIVIVKNYKLKAGTNIMPVDVSHLSAGGYFIRVSGADEQTALKFMK